MFDEINLMILKSPTMMEQLRIMFYVKLWALILLACFFVYLIYCDQKEKAAAARRRKDEDQFRA